MAAHVAAVLLAFARVAAPTIESFDGPLWTERSTTELAEARASSVRDGMPALTELVKNARPAVVSIAVEEVGRQPMLHGDPFPDFFDGFSGPSEGLGAGFVIHPSGLIVTNAHVVERAQRIKVTLEDQGFSHTLEARILGTDSETDLALLKVDTDHPLPVLPLGDSDEVEIADWVVAIGNPFGLSQTVTVGIVSHKGRTDVTPQGRQGYFDFIQTDASINPGNSGGPLLNLHGEVVGINNAVNASGQGIGFAVPINMAKKVIPQLARHGKVMRSWLGISIEDPTLELANQLGLREPGVLVTAVTPDSPAEQAGLRAGDVIVRFDGRPVRGAGALRWEVACTEAGSRVSLHVMRNGKVIRLEAVLRPVPGEQTPPPRKRPGVPT